MVRRVWHLPPARLRDAGVVTTTAVVEGDRLIIIVNAMTIVAELNGAEVEAFAKWLLGEYVPLPPPVGER